MQRTDPQLMRPGMSMRVEVIRRKVEGALIVPRAAVSSYPGKTEVLLAFGIEPDRPLPEPGDDVEQAPLGLDQGGLGVAAVPRPCEAVR